MRRLIPLVVLTVLYACSGASNGGPQSGLPPASPQGDSPQSVLAATPAPTPMATLRPYTGFTYGTDNLFTPNDGDTSSGGTKPGQRIGNFTCAPQMYDSSTYYHVHAFLGILVNGNRVAVPDAIGLPGGMDSPAGFVKTATCYFALHTHDSSGYIHIESNLKTSSQQQQSLATLGDLLNIWGQPITSTRFGPFYGTVRVFYAKTNYGNALTGNWTATSSTNPAHPYVAWTYAPSSLPLYSHEAIWIEVGSTYVPASRLPAVAFDIQF